MAFNINDLAGTAANPENWSASYITYVEYSGVAGAPVTVNADGSYTITSFGTSYEDHDGGFPLTVAPHDLGLPGNPAFVPTDITGFALAVYAGPGNPFPGATVTQAQIDNTGTPNVAGEIGGKVVAYSPQGYLVEGLAGFDTGFGGGTPNNTYLFYSTSAELNTQDAAGNPATPGLVGPITLEPLSFNFAVPEPSMGVVLGFAFCAVIVARTIRGRSAAV